MKKTRILHKAIFKLSKIYVVHSIPGRLRVKITGLNHAKDMVDATELQTLFQRYRLRGVHASEVNFLSSKALITYDETIINEEQILAFLNRVREKMFDLFAEHGQITEDLIDELFMGLKEEGYEFED